eukprot:SAG22_NODE_4_length_44774_cov_362.122149_16_plen_89_part_00
MNSPGFVSGGSITLIVLRAWSDYCSVGANHQSLQTPDRMQIHLIQIQIHLIQIRLINSFRYKYIHNYYFTELVYVHTCKVSQSQSLDP